MIRLTVRTALSVCSVASTKWPVSAAVIASEIVSRSRSSPITITSGSSRRAARSARANDSVWRFTLRWFTTQRFDGCRYSIGSSIVRMCSARSSLIRFTSAAMRRRLAARRRAGDQHHALVEVGELRERVGQAEVVERRRLERDAPEGRVEPAQLAVHVRAEARETLHACSRSRSRRAASSSARSSAESADRISFSASGGRELRVGHLARARAHAQAQVRAAVQVDVARVLAGGVDEQRVEPAVERDPDDTRGVAAGTGRAFAAVGRSPAARPAVRRASSRARSRGGGRRGPRLARQILGGARVALGADLGRGGRGRFGPLLLGARDHAALELDGLAQRRLVDEAEREQHLAQVLGVARAALLAGRLRELLHRDHLRRDGDAAEQGVGGVRSGGRSHGPTRYRQRCCRGVESGCATRAQVGRLAPRTIP